MDTDTNPEASQSILIEGELTEKILGAAFKVQTSLGTGFVEKVYENAMVVELRRVQVAIDQQKSLKVHYEGVLVGDFQET